MLRSLPNSPLRPRSESVRSPLLSRRSAARPLASSSRSPPSFPPRPRSSLLALSPLAKTFAGTRPPSRPAFSPFSSPLRTPFADLPSSPRTGTRRRFPRVRPRSPPSLRAALSLSPPRSLSLSPGSPPVAPTGVPRLPRSARPFRNRLGSSAHPFRGRLGSSMATMAVETHRPPHEERRTGPPAEARRDREARRGAERRRPSRLFDRLPSAAARLFRYAPPRVPPPSPLHALDDPSRPLALSASPLPPAKRHCPLPRVSVHRTPFCLICWSCRRRAVSLRPHFASRVPFPLFVALPSTASAAGSHLASSPPAAPTRSASRRAFFPFVLSQLHLLPLFFLPSSSSSSSFPQRPFRSPFVRFDLMQRLTPLFATMLSPSVLFFLLLGRSAALHAVFALSTSDRAWPGGPCPDLDDPIRTAPIGSPVRLCLWIALRLPLSLSFSLSLSPFRILTPATRIRYAARRFRVHVRSFFTPRPTPAPRPFVPRPAAPVSLRLFPPPSAPGAHDRSSRTRFRVPTTPHSTLAPAQAPPRGVLRSPFAPQRVILPPFPFCDLLHPSPAFSSRVPRRAPPPRAPVPTPPLAPLDAS